MAGRYNVAFEDLRAATQPALRHRVFLNFEADAAGVTTDSLLLQLLEAIVPEPVAA
jgi:MoxR-like ATPase